MFSYTDTDGYTLFLNADLKGAIASLFSGKLAITLDATVENPDGEKIKVSGITITISKLMSLLEVLKKAESAQRPADFLKPLFSEASALMEIARAGVK